MAPPVECPTTCALSIPSASMRPMTSAASRSTVYDIRLWSLWPTPRWSKTTASNSREKAGSWSRQKAACPVKPLTNTTGNPPPCRS